MLDFNINKLVDQTKIQSNRKTELNQIQDKLNNSNNGENDEELLKTCKEFESIFMDIVMKEMQSTVPDGGLTEKTYAREVYEGMFSEEVTKEVTKADNGIGLAKVIYESMKNK